jgi:hypothetical protein
VPVQSGDQCSVCRFVWPDHTCHAHPPSVVVGVMSTIQPSWVWPTIVDADWCGEFQAVVVSSSDPPVISTAPVVRGNVGQPAIMSCTEGEWINNPSSFTYQWMRNGVAISGASGNYFQTSTLDIDCMITCVVTAANDIGSSSATSNAVGPII